LPRTRIDRHAAVLAVAALFLALGACSSGSSAPAVSPLQRAIRRAAVTPAPAAITVADDVFEPKLIKVRADSDITFTNTGHRLHDVIPVDGGGFRITTDELRPGVSKTVRVAAPGTYRYFCSIHGTATRGMRGTIVVVR